MHSTLFTVFGLPIRAYGLMMVVGFAFGIWRAIRVSKKRYGIEPERVYDMALVALVGGVLGARVVFILLNPDTESWGRFFAVWEGGLSFHGGLACALLFGYFYTRFAKLSFWTCCDLVAPSTAIGYASTRIGCFLNGCCYGAPTDLPWGVRFLENGALTPPSHPTQIYATIIGLVTFVILVKLEAMRRKPGFVFMSYLLLYSIYRFGIEFLRARYSAELWHFGLTEAQAASVAIAALAAAAILFYFRKPDKSADESGAAQSRSASAH